jgi:hypothetical protein
MGVTPEHARCFGNKALAEEARIAADEHAMRCGEGFDVGSDSADGKPYIGHRKFVGHNRTPSRGTEFDCRAHLFLHVAFLYARSNFVGRKVHTATPGADRQVSARHCADGLAREPCDRAV